MLTLLTDNAPLAATLDAQAPSAPSPDAERALADETAAKAAGFSLQAPLAGRSSPSTSAILRPSPSGRSPRAFPVPTLWQRRSGARRLAGCWRHAVR